MAEDTVTADTDTGDTGAGGDIVVPVIPILAGAYFAVSATAGLYSSYKNIQYQNSAMKENERFWNDYYRSTGYKARYPYRAGSVYNTSSLYGSYASAVGAWSPIVGYGYGQYQARGNKYRGNPSYTDWMYA